MEEAYDLNDVSRFEDQFVEIKEYAWRKNELPSKEYKFTIIDKQYFNCMKSIYEKYRVKLIAKEDAEKEVNLLRLKYIHEKDIEYRRYVDGRNDFKNKQRVGETVKRLVKQGNEMTMREIMIAIFWVLIPNYTDEVTARLIREKVCFKILTGGTSNLTEEEIDELIRVHRLPRGSYDFEEKENNNAAY